MSDIKSYDHMLPLIHKYIKGECSLIESERLESWVLEDSDHKQFYIQIKESWILTQMVQKPVQAKTRSWSELLDKAANDDLQTAPTKVIKLFNSRMIMRIAAGLLIVAAALFFIDQINNDGSYHFKADTLMAETTLPDHSEVILSDHASLRFKEDEQGNRHVELSGSGFFTVAHDSLAPFIIENEEALITVLGTSFFVDNLTDQNKTIVSVATGSVSVNYAGSTMVLKVNEAVSIDRKTGALNRTKLTDQNFRFFKTKTLSFENVDLTEVIKQINLFYGSDIKIDPALHNCKLTAVYKNQSLDALLKVLQTTFSVELSKNGSQIYLTGSC